MDDIEKKILDAAEQFKRLMDWRYSTISTKAEEEERKTRFDFLVRKNIEYLVHIVELNGTKDTKEIYGLMFLPFCGLKDWTINHGGERK